MSQVLVLGQPGEEVSLELILRVVADVGLVVSITLFFIFVCNFKFFKKIKLSLGFLVFLFWGGWGVGGWRSKH